MTTLLTLLSQRRIWAAISAFIAFILPLLGYNGIFDQNAFVGAILSLIEAISILATIILPIWSFWKPKK